MLRIRGRYNSQKTWADNDDQFGSEDLVLSSTKLATNSSDLELAGVEVVLAETPQSRFVWTLLKAHLAEWIAANLTKENISLLEEISQTKLQNVQRISDWHDENIQELTETINKPRVFRLKSILEIHSVDLGILRDDFIRDYNEFKSKLELFCTKTLNGAEKKIVRLVEIGIYKLNDQFRRQLIEEERCLHNKLQNDCLEHFQEIIDMLRNSTSRSFVEMSKRRETNSQYHPGSIGDFCNILVSKILMLNENFVNKRWNCEADLTKLSATMNKIYGMLHVEQTKTLEAQYQNLQWVISHTPELVDTDIRRLTNVEMDDTVQKISLSMKGEIDKYKITIAALQQKIEANERTSGETGQLNLCEARKNGELPVLSNASIEKKKCIRRSDSIRELPLTLSQGSP